MLKIQNSVGHGGRNQLHDVAIVQYMLKFFTRSKNGRPYFRGPIDGIYGGPLSGAVLNFHRDFIDGSALPGKERDEIIRDDRLFTPKGGLYKWLALWTSDSVFLKTGCVFSGTPILYEAKNTTGERREARAYLIPFFLGLPRKFILGKMTLDTRIDHVEFVEKPAGKFRFEVHLTLRGVGRFLHPDTLQLETEAGKFAKGILKKQLSGSSWSPGPRTLKGSHFSLISRNVTEIGQATAVGVELARRIEGLSGNSDFSRVYWDELRKSYRIPPTDKILNIVGRIHAETCANSGKAGGRVFNKPIEKYAVTVLEKALNKDLVASQQRHCESCRELAYGIKFSREHQGELIAQMEGLDEEFRRFAREETNSQDFKDAQNFLGRAGANAIPLVGDKLFQVEKTETEQVAGILTDIAEMLFELDAKMGNLPKGALNVVGAKKTAGNLIVIAAIVNSMYEFSESYSEQDDNLKRFQSYRLSLHNIALDLHAEVLKERAKSLDYLARKCTVWFG